MIGQAPALTRRSSPIFSHFSAGKFYEEDEQK